MWMDPKAHKDAMFDETGKTEKRVFQFEQRQNAAKFSNENDEHVDKSVRMVNGFADDALEQVEGMVREMLATAGGSKGVDK